MPVRYLRLLGPAIALLLLVAAVARADNEEFAEHLHKLNPAALLGGKSTVGTKPKQELHGVHGKPNFIVALGDGATIHGASKNNQLGAIGDGAKIVPPNHGHSLIVAGPHSKIVVSGQGHNLIVSHANGATIILESPGDEVIANGPHDRIVCAKHANHELIEVAKGEKVTRSCKGHHNTIEHLTTSFVSARSSAATAHNSSARVTGDGSNENPYGAACDDPSKVDCTVSSFASVTLNGFWTTESVPAYACPQDHGYLLNQNYAPAGTSLINGVEVEGLGKVGVSILASLDLSTTLPRRVSGTATGEGSSATNWAIPFGPASYKVILHCTSDFERGYSR